MKYKQEVLSYMNKINFKTSLKYYFLILSFLLISTIISKDYSILKILTPSVTLIMIFAHYASKYANRRMWYSYYEALYDTKQLLLKKIRESEAYSSGSNLMKLKKIKRKLED